MKGLNGLKNSEILPCSCEISEAGYKITKIKKFL